MKASFDQEYRDTIRRKTREAHKNLVRNKFWTGGKVFGYKIVLNDPGNPKSPKILVIFEEEAEVVRQGYDLFADGHGYKQIAKILNLAGALSPRAKEGRPSGWSKGTVRDVLDRPLYRGQLVWGRSKKMYGRELPRGVEREMAQIRQPEDTWICVDAPELRIVDPYVAEAVDKIRAARKRNYKARKPGTHRSRGKYLLTGACFCVPIAEVHSRH